MARRLRSHSELSSLLRRQVDRYVRDELERCGIGGARPSAHPALRAAAPVVPLGQRLRAGFVRLLRPAAFEPAPPAYDPEADPVLIRARLTRSIDGLRTDSPRLSAYDTFDRRQRWTARALVATVTLCLLLAPMATLVTLVALATVLYVVTTGYRLLLFKESLRAAALVDISDDEARATPDGRLPVYTVLVPAYREPEVVANLLRSLDAMEYPRHRLDVKLLLEEDDTATIEAVRAAGSGPHIQVVLVPPADPRTKPKALNFGLSVARGEFVTVYDAEDRPHPLQLRKAVAAFARVDPSVACLQAKLSYFNPNQNMLTKWFTIEYAMWFSQFLPGLVARSSPLPLGGTSNHFRRTVLLEVGAWDPFNVTEDADLGIRLHRLGHRTGVLESTTLEEANSDVVNWVKQRSRWYKGYLQTWLVHMRHPRRLWRELGPRGFIGFNLFVGGTPALALINPVFWFFTLLWFVGEPRFILELFPAPVYYVSLLCWCIGNFLFVYLSVITSRTASAPELLGAALLAPLYWVLMSAAAVKATLQLLHQPSFWEKTTHGLGPVDSGRAEPVPKRTPRAA